MNARPIASRTFGSIPVHIFESNAQLGQRAADDLSNQVTDLLRKQERAAMILATGNSQLTFINALRMKKELPWDRILVFHMDEYLGMPENHPESFSLYIRERLVNFVHPAAFYPIFGDSADARLEMERYAALLTKFPPDFCVLGIGENGHLAFNDPPADFETKDILKLVTLDQKCRMQQVNEGHFLRIEDVPPRALTLTVPALLSAKHVLAVVPEARKAAAVNAALEGPITPYCPASILRTKPNVVMYLDRESASLIT